MNDATNIDSLLDSTLDSLADLPEFKIFPAGAYNGPVKLTVKKMGDNMGVELSFTNAEVVELSDPTAEAPAVGATTAVGFLLNNEYGQGDLKKTLASLKEGLGLPDGMTSREMMEATADTMCMVVFGVRSDRKDATKMYQSLKSVTVL
jgi:hypothetical protein